jgi:hypothetical protein
MDMHCFSSCYGKLDASLSRPYSVRRKWLDTLQNKLLEIRVCKKYPKV